MTTPSTPCGCYAIVTAQFFCTLSCRARGRCRLSDRAGIDPFRSFSPACQGWATAGEADIQAAAFRTRRNGKPRADRRRGAEFAERIMLGTLLETMARQAIASGTVHRMPIAFRKAIESDPIVTNVCASITPPARNEWICWVTSAKKDETRNRRIVVGLDKMRKGMRRPCCWPGCPHR